MSALTENMAAQEILEHIHEEILSTTRLPFAIQFLATEMKHSGLLSSGFSRLPHYFTPYQTFIICQTEVEGLRFSIQTALLILEREGAVPVSRTHAAGFVCLSIRGAEPQSSWLRRGTGQHGWGPIL